MINSLFSYLFLSVFCTLLMCSAKKIHYFDHRLNMREDIYGGGEWKYRGTGSCPVPLLGHALACSHALRCQGQLFLGDARWQWNDCQDGVSPGDYPVSCVLDALWCDSLDRNAVLHMRTAGLPAQRGLSYSAALGERGNIATLKQFQGLCEMRSFDWCMFSNSGLGPGTVGFTELNKVFSLPSSPGSNAEWQWR